MIDRLITKLIDLGLDKIQLGGLHIVKKRNGQVIITITPEGTGDYIHVEE